MDENTFKQTIGFDSNGQLKGKPGSILKKYREAVSLLSENQKTLKHLGLMMEEGAECIVTLFDNKVPRVKKIRKSRIKVEGAPPKVRKKRVKKDATQTS